MKYALISVYDKTGIVEFARELEKLDITIFSTTGTLKTLEESGIKNVKDVYEITGFPEILDGRIKTEHPKLIGGILASRKIKSHMKELDELQIEPIDIVVCNLYPFYKIIQKKVKLQTALENIDIGGPNMIRAAAKNFQDVVVLVNPKRYNQVLEEFRIKRCISFQTRKLLANEAFKLTFQYDLAISKFLENCNF
jgi:phosphoribosylaminoimidazolecarboxamide formyltransferase/IMP cyclohydrolase